jgi:predicted anti-sigma-YlaC factor YlaD
VSDCLEIRPLLARVADGEASPEEAMRLGLHLPDCTGCRILLARERRLAAILEQGLEDRLHVGEDFLEAVMAAVPDAPPPRQQRQRQHGRAIR